MLKDNLVSLRNLHGFSQEEIAEKIHISRQAYAKWETGSTVPDIEKCRLLAEVYRVTLDSLVNEESMESTHASVLVPQGKRIWGSVTISDRGQVIIPKEARETLGMAGGTRIIVLSDEDGIALVSAEKFEEKMRTIMELAAQMNERD